MDLLNNNWYNATLPGFIVTTTVWYIFYLEDKAGNRLIWDNDGANFSYYVPDFTPPDINNVTFIPLIPEYNQSTIISVNCNDSQSGISSVLIIYQINNNLTWFTKQAINTFGYYWNASIGPFSYNDQISFYVNVTDGAGLVSTDNNAYNYYNFTSTDSYAPVIDKFDIQEIVVNYNESATVLVHLIDGENSAGISTAFLNYSIDFNWQTLISNLSITGA
jgi:hypothetical protein